MKGVTIGDCVLETPIGRGAMGIVFSAQSKKLNRKVAVKILEPKLSGDPKFVNRFFQEARALALLDNPHVVRVFDFDKDDQGRHYIIMELLDGGSVQRTFKLKGKLEIEDAVRIASEAAKGLHAAHRSDLVHRDVKPANLMLTKDGRVKVVDFGLAVPTQGEVFLATEVVGTPIYMAPEQADGLRLDGRCDQYALGVTLYQLVCGRAPFERTRPVDVIKAHMTEAPPPPHELRDDIPAWLQDVILKMLAKAPGERFASMAEVYQALDSRGQGLKPVDLDRLARPAVSVDATRIAELDSKGIKADAVRMPGWSVVAAIAVASIAVGVLVSAAAKGRAATLEEGASDASHVAARVLEEAKGLASAGAPADLAAALARLESDRQALGAEGAALEPVLKETRAKLDDLHTKRVAALGERVSQLLEKHRYGAAIEAASDDPATVEALGLADALSELRARAASALEHDKGEVFVPAGKFRSGPDGVPAGSRAYYIEKTEVTNARWAQAVLLGAVTAPATWPGGKLPAELAARPVTGVSYEDADRFARSIQKRLPTSSEWEKAARGSDDARAWPWGDSFVSGKANLLDGGSGALEDVTARPGDASPYGVLGMAGNALEWVTGLDGPLVAGGGFGSDSLSARVFTRIGLAAKDKDPALGFRCARDLETGE